MYGARFAGRISIECLRPSAGEDARSPSEELLEPKPGAPDARKVVDAPSIPAGIVGLSLTKQVRRFAGAAWQRPYIWEHTFGN